MCTCILIYLCEDVVFYLCCFIIDRSVVDGDCNFSEQIKEVLCCVITVVISVVKQQYSKHIAAGHY